MFEEYKKVIYSRLECVGKKIDDASPRFNKDDTDFEF